MRKRLSFVVTQQFIVQVFQDVQMSRGEVGELD